MSKISKVSIYTYSMSLVNKFMVIFQVIYMLCIEKHRLVRLERKCCISANKETLNNIMYLSMSAIVQNNYTQIFITNIACIGESSRHPFLMHGSFIGKVWEYNLFFFIETSPYGRLHHLFCEVTCCFPEKIVFPNPTGRKQKVLSEVHHFYRDMNIKPLVW